MSHNNSHRLAELSPTQRKACIVLAACAAALIVSIIAASFLAKPSSGGKKGGYDPDAYPLDTSLSAVLGATTADDSYITSSVFAGDQTAVTLSQDSRITLDQYVGKDGLLVAQVGRESCVNFEEDSNSYTLLQAIAKMKPRRVIVTLGSADAAAGTDVSAFLTDYKQLLQNIKAAYSYCDVIAAGVVPVTESSTNAAATQTLIDQYNQGIAALCEDLDCKYLNTAEVLKTDSGYGEDTYFSGSGLSRSGATALANYIMNHAYQTDDRRPDTNDIPKRAAAAVGVATPTPTPTPEPIVYSYEVEDKSKGSLTGNGQTGVASLEIEAQEGDSITVTAVAAEGYVFYKWSDGVTDAKRVDVVSRAGKSVKAMFNDARVEVKLDRTDVTIKKGESVTVTGFVKLGEKDYDSSKLQWAVNGELQSNGSSYTFKGDNAGTYTIKAGIEINGTYASAEFKVTVQADPTTVTIDYKGSIIAPGQDITLTAKVTNPSGSTTWSCDEIGWTASGDTATFRPDAAGTYTIHAKNNGVDATVTITVKAPTPPPTTNPDTGASSGSDSGASSGSDPGASSGSDPGSSSADGQ